MTNIDPNMAAAATWAWEAFGKDLIGGGIKQLMRAIGLGGQRVASEAWERFEWRRAAEAYRRKLRERYSTVRVLGKSDPIPLAGIFTDVYLLDKLSAERYYDIAALREDPKRVFREQERKDGLALIRQPEYRRLMILGKPGAGKTTFLKSLTMQAVEGKLAGIPIFVSLREWSDSGYALSMSGLLGFIAEQFDICGFPDAGEFVTLILRDGQALALLDGLDEVNQEGDQRRQAIHAIRNFADKFDAAQVVMTCRVAANEYAFERFKYAEMADFDDAQIRHFVDRWFKDDARIRDRFDAEFGKPENRGLRELANNPMLLSLLCLAFEETLAFPPNRRIEIYKQAVEALLRKWDAARGITRDTIYKGLSLGQRETLISYAAAKTFDDGEVFFKRERLARVVADFLRRLPGQASSAEDGDGDAVLRAVEAQHGVWVEWAKGIYAFSHLSLHEYFAANYVVKSAGGEALARLLALERAADDRWREVILNTAGMLDDADAFFAAFERAIRRAIGSDPEIHALMRWVKAKANACPSADQRVTYVLVFLFTHAHTRTRTRDPARTRARALALARDLVRARDLALALALARDLARDLALALTLALDLARALDRDLILDPLGSILIELTPAMSAAAHGINERARYVALLKEVAQLAREAKEDELAAALEVLEAPPAGDAAAWSAFEERLRALFIRHRNIGQRWHLSDAQFAKLADILAASKLMLECLDVATVSPEVRRGVRERLLLPPEEAGSA